ncbi:MAG: sulfite exporter TauE/SafE family protein [Alphaproteobacteria bacterium]|nr:sulfite exporter TauE/SafE family protein [Alphaproteobacteria bacterium]
MHIYLPIAQLSINWLVLIGLGLAVGMLSGMLGVSGGFITTPLLIFYGIPAAVAVASQASPVAAASFVGAMRQGGRKSVDYKMGLVLLAGGLAGSAIGVWIFKMLQGTGQIDFTVKLSYLILLGSIGSMMLTESVQTIRAARRGENVSAHKPGQHTWIHNLPFKMRFRQSRLYISAIPVVMLGFVVGVMTAILGTGGAFILIPAKVYLLRMRTNLAIGTSQFQMFIVACMATMMHAVIDQTVDIMLAFILVMGGVVGAQIGSTLGTKLKSEELRTLLAVLILIIAARLLWSLTAPPATIYSLSTAVS